MDVLCLYINVNILYGTIQMAMTPMKSRQWLFTACFIVCVTNHKFSAVAASVLSTTRINDTYNTPMHTAGDSTLFAAGTTPPPILESKNQTTQTAIVDNVEMHGDTKHNASTTTSGDTVVVVLPNNIFGSAAINISRRLLNYSVAPSLEIPMIITGSASMRLKSSDENDMNNTVLQWYTYCSEYVSNVWHEAGYDQSPLVLSFDWIQIDKTRLDVFFTGVHPFVPEHVLPICLDSNKTLQNDTVHDDVCSQLTLGGFGKNLISSSNTQLKVRINQTINALSTIITHEYLVNSLMIKRLSISSSYIDKKGLVSIQDGSSRKNIFDNTIKLFVSCLPGLEPIRSNCRYCLESTYKKEAGSHSCSLCAMGFYAQTGATTCISCPQSSSMQVLFDHKNPTWTYLDGRWQDIKNVACVCRPGFEGTPNQNCVPCSIPGTFSPGGGTVGDYDFIAPAYPGVSVSCQSCTAGTYSPNAMSGGCLPCPPGTHSSEQAAAQCTQCWYGKYKVSGGLGLCTDCDVGEYQDNRGSLACIPCQAGTFNTGTSQRICTKCPVGKHQSGRKSLACSDCEIGKYQNLIGFAECTPCPANTEELSTGSTGCTCKANTYQAIDSEVHQQCALCPTGMTTDVGVIGIGYESCQCAEGSFRNKPTDGICTPCPHGYTSSWGTINNYDEFPEDICRCDKLKGYHKQIVGNNMGCALCPGGSEYDDTVCRTCDKCKLCAKGKFRHLETEDICEDCPTGKFASSVGAIECSDCTGEIKNNRSECVLADAPIVLDPPKIMHHSTIVVFDHFEDNTLVKTILGSVDPPDWKSGDTVRIYENGTRNLNPVVFVYNDAKWSPININPTHNRDNVYVFNTPRSENYPPHYMSILWQNTHNVELLLTYMQRINMQPHFLRKQFGVLSSDDILAQNTANSHYTPFEVRVINNEPIYTTQIMYG